MNNTFEDWIYIDNIKELPNCKNIYCDTRDFHIIGNNMNDEENPIKIDKKLIKLEFIIDDNKILSWLKYIEKISGGKKKWRLLRFNMFNFWIKYIRFYKINENEYFVYTTNYIKTGRIIVPLPIDKLNKQTFLIDE